MARQEISLNSEDWALGQCLQGQGMDDVTRWIPAVVPGNVRDDLLRAGMIEQPYVARQNELAQWVDDWNWWYHKEIDTPPGPKRTFLRFDGIDYKSHIFLNGRKIADNEGMFAPLTIEISDLITRKNMLSVNIEYAGQFEVREKTLKCQMGFGWDFAPAIRTSGIWDSVTLIRTGDVFVRFMHVEPVFVDDGYWEAEVTLGLDSRKDIAASADFVIDGDNFDTNEISYKKQLRVPLGFSEHKFIIPMKEPELWNPWEDGKQNIYRMTVKLTEGKKELDDTSTKFGLRRIELQASDKRPEDFWTFVVNGRKKFIRGANWVPCDSLPGRVGRDRYLKLLKMAKQANINMLRVWGGGLREKEEFYEICDELGIMVWQEFPLACGRKPYPRDKAFFDLVKKETNGILSKLFNHPSIVYYSGGNEINQTFNRRLINLLERQTRRLSGGRPFRPASPTAGESHNYRVFHALGNLDEYTKEKGSFLSEFGMQSVPNRESLDKFIPRKHQWPVSPQFPYMMSEFSFTRAEKFDPINRIIISNPERRNTELWVYHDAQLLKLFRYAKEIGFTDCESFIDATQRMQAQALQIAVEHMRRRKYEAGGVMFWQFNEPWPSICWSIIDYYLEPKLAYHKLKEIYNPLLFSLQYDLGPYKPGQLLEANGFIINDKHTGYHDIGLEIAVIDGNLEKVQVDSIHVDNVEADSVLELGTLKLELTGEEGWRIECKILKNEKVLSRNTYDLSIVDNKTSPGVLMLGDWFMHNIAWK
ncbi:MAG TPA: glycoside hydrolase family 2 TIM barrel-domain containing protein [bacterium]|nr:glycoside hydrolase family 2 TIM barrel-domain containing protein [bacterium]